MHTGAARDSSLRAREMTPKRFSSGNEHLVRRSRSRILGCLSAVLEDGGPIALLDFPEYANVGDSAIWLGQRAALWSLGLPDPVYTASHRDFSARELRSRLPRGTILLSGGGNLGDLYPAHQRLRERVVEAFPEHRIVILPQSIHFRSERARDRARRTFDAHPDLHLFVRTARSRRIADRHFSATVRLCPDMAFALGPLPHVRADPPPRLHLLRRDGEAAGGHEVPESRGDVEVVDWGEEGDLPGRWEALSGWARWLHRAPGGIALRGGMDYLRDARTRAAWARLLRGIGILSGREYVVTDRLHGHILALLMDVPHAVWDNSYGKNHAYVATWTGHREPGRGEEGEPPSTDVPTNGARWG